MKRLVLTLIAGGVLAVVSATGTEPFDATAATTDELIFYSQQYATTTSKHARKVAAWDELRARGTNAFLRFLDWMHTDNVMVFVRIEEFVRALPDEEAAALLLERACSSDEPRTRRVCVFLAGTVQAPRFAQEVVPFLDDTNTVGAAIRTLGKWRHTNAVPRIVEALEHEREGRRIVAVNALRDIGDPRAVEALIARLDDPVFTVRETAARALSTLGAPAEKALLRGLEAASPRAKRHAIRILGVMKSRRARRALRRLLDDPDPFVREDARAALSRIEEKPSR